jgi:mRNA-degrading endonuclease YafQ of YafQ-DinJ toxin-antitoxin module
LKSALRDFDDYHVLADCFQVYYPVRSETLLVMARLR